MLEAEVKTSISHKFFILTLGILLGMTPFVCKSAYMFDFSNLPQSAYLQCVSLFMLIMFCVRGIILKQLQVKWTWFYLPIGGIILWSFISLFWATNPAEGLVIWLNWQAGGILFFVIYNVLKTSQDIRYFFYCLLIPVIFIVVVGLNQALETEWFQFYPQIIAPAATFGNKNMMVDALVILMPTALLITLQAQFTQFYFKIIGGILYGSCVVLIVLSNTRAGLLAIIIQGLVYIILITVLNKRKSFSAGFYKQWLLIHFICAIVSVLLLYSLVTIKNTKIEKSGVGFRIDTLQVLSRLQSIFQTKEQDKWALKTGNTDITLKSISDSRTIRLVTWQNTFVMFLDKPFKGVGLFNWQIHYGEYRNAYLNDPVYRPGMKLAEVHNDYLQLLVDLGLIGALFALLLLMMNLRVLYIVIRRGTEDDKIMGVILGMCLLGLHLVAIFSFPFERSVPVMLFFMNCAFLAFLNEKYTVNNSFKALYLNRIKTITLSILLIALWVGMLYAQNRRFAAEIEFKASIDQHEAGNYEVAVRHSQKALQLNPYRFTTYFLLGYSSLCVDDFKGAETALLKGLQYYPNDLNSLLQIGTTYTKMTMKALFLKREEDPEVKDLLQKADVWFAKALSIRNDFPTIYFNQGVLFWQRYIFAKARGEVAKAEEYKLKTIESYKKSIEYNPSYIDGLTTLSQFLFDYGEKKEAVAYAEKAANLLMEDFEKTEKEIAILEEAKALRTSQLYSEANKSRKRARQMLIASLMKSLQILKIYYGVIEVNFDKYFEVLLKQEKYYLAKEIEIQEKLLYAEDAFNRQQSYYDPESNIYQALLKEYQDRKGEFYSFSYEKHLEKTSIELDKGVVYQNMKKYDSAVKALSNVISNCKVINAATPPYVVKELKAKESNAHLNLIDIYCILSTEDHASQQLNPQKFIELLPKIETHLRTINIEKGDPLYQRFVAVTVKFAKYKELAIKLLEKK